MNSQVVKQVFFTAKEDVLAQICCLFATNWVQSSAIMRLRLRAEAGDKLLEKA